MSDDALSSSLPSLLRDALGESYTIEGEIGRGGMGVVYRARDERLHRRVAVKVLPPELAFQKEIRERFTREAQTAARLSHPHIVPIHDVGEGKGIVYFVMGLIEGESLAARIRRKGRLPADEVRRVMRETADALSAAHAVSVIHRDIKPDNILLEGTRGRVVVTDFGIAKAMSASSSATLTSAGMAIGTPSFMSPEQAAGERDIDGRSDVYSLGVVAYQMLSGELPFSAPTVAGILMKHITEPAQVLHEKFGDIPEDLSLAVARCLEKDPANRWASADALRRALESRNMGGYRPTGQVVKTTTRTERPSTRTTPRRTGRQGSDTRAPRAIGERPTRSPRPLTDSPRSRRGQKLPDRPERGMGLARRTREEVRAASRSSRNRKRNEPVLPETGEPKVVRQVRAEFAKTAALTGGLFMINLVTGLDTPWFLFPAGFTSIGLFRRYAELWQSGYSWRDVLNRPPAPDAIQGPGSKQLHAGLSVPEPGRAEFGRFHGRMRDIHKDRSAILSLWGRLSEADRHVVADVPETVDALYNKATQLATTLHDTDDSVSPLQLQRIDEQIAVLQERETEANRREIELLERQRNSVIDLVSRHDQIMQRFKSCALSMQTLRFEMLRLREKGIGAMGNEFLNATQQARAVSRDVNMAIDAAGELRESLS
jgi:serine/threonine protein kinase